MSDSSQAESPGTQNALWSWGEKGLLMRDWDPPESIIGETRERTKENRLRIIK